jgi:Ca-activated chloride channel homolog
MHRRRPYPYARLSLAIALLVTQACADTSSDETRTIGENAAHGGDPSTAIGSGDESAADDDSEEPLDPGRRYPQGGTGAHDAAAPPSARSDAGSAAKPATGAPAADSDDGLREPPPSTRPPVAARAPVNPFVDASKDPFSTFGADVDTASYDYLRQRLMYSTLPTPEAVRVEEYVNYFKYAYAMPPADAAQPFSISLAASPHPMGRSTTLVRVGIQAKAKPAMEKRAANLVFLVDVSGSMASPEKLPLVKRVLEQSLNVLDPADKVSIVTYAGDTSVRLAPTPVSSRDAIASVVKGLEAGGGTNGGSGIQLAYAQASAGFITGGINHVVLCTDGDFNIGITSSDALLALIREKRTTGVTLTALGFGRDNLNDTMMEKVSNAGNGSYSIVYSEDQAVEYANERLLATIVHVAKDMKIQVEFNPAAVAAYRLVGYEDRAIADGSFRNDAVDGGEVGAEHRVTALYEVVLAGAPLPQATNVPALSVGETSDTPREIDPSELVRVKVRSKAVTATDADPATEVVAALKPTDVAAADADTQWAVAVATLAEHLRKSPYTSAAELDAVQRVVTEQQARDQDRAEFATLFAKIRGLLAITPVP